MFSSIHSNDNLQTRIGKRRSFKHIKKANVTQLPRRHQKLNDYRVASMSSTKLVMSKSSELP